MSELAPLLDNLAAPPLAAMHKSSSDKMLAAVTDEDIFQVLDGMYVMNFPKIKIYAGAMATERNWEKGSPRPRS